MLACLGLFSLAAAAQPQETFADLPGLRLWFKDSGGSGVPVVFLHASAGSSANWEHQIAAVTQAGYRFIAYDRRGWGRSITTADAPPATAADDLQALMKYLRIDRFHLVATAGGGIVAFDYALSFPQQLLSLVVANSIGGVQDEQYLTLGRTLRPPQFEALPAELRELGPSYRATDLEGTRRWIELERMSRQPGAAAQPLRNRMTFSMLESIKLPVLLITGAADLYTPPPLLKMFSARIRGAQSLVMPEAGHSAYWESPDAFNKAVLDFIGKH
jgi:pimeloyl-ACP methyl ester carboxylesterase